MRGDFEVRYKDLAGRVGLLLTRHGRLETPCLLPVVNPVKQAFSIRKMREIRDCQGVMTNAYILWKRLRDGIGDRSIHDILGFDRVVATDSGGYQVLEYGRVEADPTEIVKFQQKIDSDIAVILDVPTGSSAGRFQAKRTVDETLKRAQEAQGLISDDHRLWMGPVQGGTHLDLVQRSASEISRMDFDILALGSPTEIMESQKYSVLADMIAAAKEHAPLQKPFHLFGAGHPQTFALAVALGCDLFDSASYVLYARKGRYMTPTGTFRMQDLEWFPCPCRTCQEFTPREARALNPVQREEFLAEHNLQVCFTEIRAVKNSIRAGRLWELLESRAASNPKLLNALRQLSHHLPFIERLTPVSKPRSLVITDLSAGLRPEVQRHIARLREGRVARVQTEILMPEPETRPASRSPPVQTLIEAMSSQPGLHLSFYSLPFSLIPLGVEEVFPISQSESCLNEGDRQVKTIRELLPTYLQHIRPRTLILSADESKIGQYLKNAVPRLCRDNRIRLRIAYKGSAPWSAKGLEPVLSLIGARIES